MLWQFARVIYQGREVKGAFGFTVGSEYQTPYRASELEYARKELDKCLEHNELANIRLNAFHYIVVDPSKIEFYVPTESIAKVKYLK